MTNMEYKRQLITDLGDSGYILIEHFYNMLSDDRQFIPTDNKTIADAIGWTISKVKRIKSQLVKREYLLVLEDTLKDNTRLYRVLLGRLSVACYKDCGHIASDSDIRKQGEYLYYGKENYYTYAPDEEPRTMEDFFSMQYEYIKQV